jgi:LPXTG-motif cell wall-anchored protein
MITNYVTYTENGVEQEKLRLDVAKSAIQSTAHALFSQNGQNGLADDAIRITLIPFNNNATIKAVTTSEQTITEQLNSITYTYYNSDSVADDLKAKIYVSSDVIFTTSANDGTANDTMIVKNKAGRPLPNTGGAGTTNLIIIGGMLALCSIIGFIWMNVKKRKSCDTNS